MQHLEDADTEDGSGGATDADDEASGLRLFHAESFSMMCDGCRKEANTETQKRKGRTGNVRPVRIKSLELSRSNGDVLVDHLYDRLFGGRSHQPFHFLAVTEEDQRRNPLNAVALCG